jgi:hypothetical protein
MLFLYVSTILLVQNMGLKLLLDSDTAKAIIFSLDVPTMLVLVIFAGLSFRQEFTKPKYNIPKKSSWIIDAAMTILGITFFGALLVIKYLI